MTPEQHIAAAEDALAAADEHAEDGLPELLQAALLKAIAHALIATAVEGGVPHATVPPAGS